MVESLMGMTNDVRKKGKSGELYVASMLLINNLNVSVPFVDDGIDLIVRSEDGAYLDLQVKTRVIINEDDGFYLDLIDKRRLDQRTNYLVVLFDLNEECMWIIPAVEVYRHTTKKKINKKEKQFISFKQIKEGWLHQQYNREAGLETIKKALQLPDNKLSSRISEEEFKKRFTFRKE